MAEEEKPSGPLEDRLSHKNWKWRVNGYEELTSKFKLSEDGTGSLFNEYGPKFKVLIADSNPMSQEKALDTLGAFIDRCDVVHKFAKDFVPVLVEKCFPSTRPKVKDKTIELLIATIEADSAEPVIENLLKGTASTSPKILLYSLMGVKECLKTFGPKVFPIKQILQKFTPWFENRDKNVREEGSNILIEIYRWVGKPLITLIQEGLTPLQMKALIESFDKLPSEPAVPLKMTRSDTAKQLSAAAKGGAGSAAQSTKKEEVEEFDPFSMMAGVNVLSKIGEEFFVGCKAAKWQERQEQIDKLVSLLQSSPKIENGDFGPLTTTLKKLIADNNVMIMTKAVVAVGLLAEGLRNQFASNSKQFVLPILERFKEKKSNIVNALHTTMDSLITKCFGLTEVIEDVVSAITNAKVAWVKQEIFNFIARTITNTKKPQDIQKVAKTLAKIFMDNISDSNEPVRESCAKAFGALGGIIGERGMNPYLGQLDPMKAKKVKDSMPAVLTPIVSTPAVTMQSVDVSEIDLGGGVKSKPSANSSKKPAAAGKTTTTTTTTTATSKNTGKSKDDDKGVGSSSSLEEVQEKVKSIIPDDQLNGLGSSNWKERLQSIEDIQETIRGLTGDTLNSMSEFIILYLQDKPGWKESNFQVFSGILQTISFLAKNDSSFNKATANHFLTTVIEKISDVKLKDLSIECLFTVSEVISPQAVFSVLYPFASSHKNPKVTVDSLVWLSQALEEFGVGCATNMKMLIDFCKQCLESTQPTTKSAAIKLLCTIRISVGPGISDYLNDVKKQLLDTIDKEFSKVRDQKPSPPTRTFKGAPAPGSSGSKAIGELPRTDISGKISGQCLDNLSDNNWKTRQDSLEEIEKIICDANKRIQPKLGSLVTALKNRLTDSNQKVITTTLNIISLLSQSIGGSGFDKNSRVLLPGVLALLSDSKKPIRDAALATMNQLLQDLGFDVFIGSIAAPMIVESATSKKEALTFATLNWQIKAPVVMAEMTTLCKAVCVCLCDKNADVRSLTEQLLNLVSQHVSLNDFKKEFREVKQANLATVTAIIDKHYKAKASGTLPSQPTNPSSKGKPSGTVSPTIGTNSPNRVTATTTSSSGNSRPTIKSQQSSNDTIIIGDHNSKVLRQKEFSGKSWAFDEPTEEVLETLQSQVLAGFSEEFANLMFSANPTQAQTMSDSLLGLIESDPDVVVNVLDILFRWVTFKLFDMGLASQKRILKILEVLLTKLISLEYTLSDYEASCLVPLLSERMSTSNESIKVLIKTAVKQLEELCPGNIMFKYIIENCKSNNWRTRLECINELASLVDKSGLSLFSNNVSNLKTACLIISQNLNEPNIKPVCILYYQKLYLHIRDEIWKFLPSNLSNSDKSLISGGSNNNTNNNSSSNNNNSSNKTNTKSSSTTSNSDDTLKGYLDILNNYQTGKDEYTVESLKQFSTYLQTNGSQKSISDKFLPLLEPFLNSITKLLDEIFPNVFKDPSLFRLCKYLIHSIITIFSNDTIAKQSNTKSLQIVLTESIKLLVAPPSDSNAQSNDSDWLTKAFNQVLLRVLQNSNGTTLFSTLLLMITTAKSNKSPDKYNDLLLRCLLRATKLLKPTTNANEPSISQNELVVSTLMNDINKFLTPGNLDDTTKRATKTLTSELINIKGTEIFKFCKDLIASHKHTNHTPLFNLLTDLLGKNQFEENIGVIPPPIDIKLDSKLDGVVGDMNLTLGSTSSGSSLSNNVNNSNNYSSISRQSSNSNLNNTSGGSSNVASGTTTSGGSTTSKFSTLKVNTQPRNFRQTIKTSEELIETQRKIFKKIGDTQLTTDGIYDLYYFLKEFPEVDISNELNLTTSSFQNYITRNLAKVKISLEAPLQEKSDDEFKKYSENLTKIQNTFHQQSSPQHNQNYSNSHQSPNTNQQSQSSTLQRMRENINITNPNITTSTPNINNNNNNNNNNTNGDLHSTVASLRQRLAQIKETSNQNN